MVDMTNKKPRTRVVDHTIYGIYVWQLPDGRYLDDGDNRQLSISAVRGDIKRMNQIKAAAAANGYADGTPVFLSGHRKITDSEYDEQMARHMSGLIADPYDIGAILDEMKSKNA